jgi:hypothetical protein
VTLEVSGTYGSVAISFNALLDSGGTSRLVQMKQLDANTVVTASGTISNTARVWAANLGAATHFRITSTAWASGTMAIRINNAAVGAEPVPSTQTHAVTGSGTFTTSLASTTLTAVTPGTAATNLGKATDAAAGATDTGVAALQRRRGTPVSGGGVSTDGDYMPLQGNLYGGQWVSYVDDAGRTLLCPKAPPGTGDSGLVVRPVGIYSGPSAAVSRTSLPVIPIGFSYQTTRVTAAACTTTALICTVDPSLVVRRGDVVRVQTGTFAQGYLDYGVVDSVNATTITLDAQTPLLIAPAAGLTLYIERPTTLKADTLGRLSITGDVSGSIVGVTPSATNKTFFESGEMDFSSLTNTLQSVLTVANTGYIIVVANSTDKAIAYSLDGGSTKGHLGPNDNVTWNFADIGGNIDGGTDFQAMYTGAAPTLGYVSFTMGYY